EYTMYDILNLMETSLKPVACLEDDYPGCDRANRCKILPVWKELDDMLVTFYKSKTLVDFMENTEEQP
ncbi:MAG: Rrf2 family transcriptional regulator, partial [Lachnospiraceae bacterium]|nr:Rrf2 family transcriptional regulator [Candidatus Equihabitans merdae]